MKADGFDALSELELDNQEYDLVIVDPPAFAKRKKQTNVALNAYMKLRPRQVLRLLKKEVFFLLRPVQFMFNP